jgi:hypothetical protein
MVGNPSLTGLWEGLLVIRTGSSTDRRVIHQGRCRQFLRLVQPR